MKTRTIPLRYAANLNSRVLPEDTDPQYRFRYVDISAIANNGTVSIPDELITFEHAPSRARRIAAAGSTAISTVRTYLRAIARVPDSADQIVLSTGFATAEAISSVDPDYLYHACCCDRFVEEVVARSTGVSYPAIIPSDLGSIEIPFPPISEQRRIARYLDDQVALIDNTLAARADQLRLLGMERDSAVRAAVTGTAVAGRRRESRLAWAGSLPSSWGEPRICQVARMGTGHTPSRSRDELWINCSIPWLTTGDVHRFRHDQVASIEDTVLHISARGLANSAAVLHPSGTVALSRTASAGFSIMMDTAMATSQDYATWTPGARLLGDYLLWSLRVMRPDIMGRLAIGSTHKTIYFPDLMSIRLPLPPIDSQRAAVSDIDAYVAMFAKHSDATGRSIDLLHELKRSLITAAVTGEFDVSSADGSRVLT